jgi:hypothetical protein
MGFRSDRSSPHERHATGLLRRAPISSHEAPDFTPGLRLIGIRESTMLCSFVMRGVMEPSVLLGLTVAHGKISALQGSTAWDARNTSSCAG